VCSRRQEPPFGSTFLGGDLAICSQLQHPKASFKLVLQIFQNYSVGVGAVKGPSFLPFLHPSRGRCFLLPVSSFSSRRSSGRAGDAVKSLSELAWLLVFECYPYEVTADSSRYLSFFKGKDILFPCLLPTTPSSSSQCAQGACSFVSVVFHLD
jgi:hypothetical protein